jgi:hypothetical protein
LKNYDSLSLSPSNSELTFAFFTYDKDKYWEEYMKDIVVVKWENLEDFLRNKKINGEKWYLTIKNSLDKDVEFCVTMGGKLIPYSDSLITVFWHYGDMEVGLQSVVKKWVPDWTLNVIAQGP